MAYPQTQIETAQRLIKKFGQLGTWIIPGVSVPVDPNNPWGSVTPGDDETYDVYIVPLPEDRQGYEWVKYIAGTEIPDGNGYLLMAGGLEFEPDISHSVLLADGITTLKPSKINKLAPTGIPILYTVKF